MVTNLMDIWTIKETVLDECYTKNHPLKESDVVIDIGSYIADFAVYASTKSKQVLSFEMDRIRFQAGKNNIKLNKCTNIKLYKQEITGLDQIFKEHNLIWCDFLKIDCEGAEYTIFNNTSKKTLHSIGYIAMEVHLFKKAMNHSFESLINRLVQTGFRVNINDNPVHSTLKFVFAKNIKPSERL